MQIRVLTTALLAFFVIGCAGDDRHDDITDESSMEMEAEIEGDAADADESGEDEPADGPTSEPAADDSDEPSDEPADDEPANGTEDDGPVCTEVRDVSITECGPMIVEGDDPSETLAACTDSAGECDDAVCELAMVAAEIRGHIACIEENPRCSNNAQPNETTGICLNCDREHAWRTCMADCAQGLSDTQAQHCADSTPDPIEHCSADHRCGDSPVEW